LFTCQLQLFEIHVEQVVAALPDFYALGVQGLCMEVSLEPRASPVLDAFLTCSSR
jgi:hypothetical protein